MPLIQCFDISNNIYSTNKINHICVQSLSPEFRDVVIDEKSVIPYLNKLKRKQFPKSPKTVQEIINAFKEEEIQKLYGKYYVHTQKPVQSHGKKYGFTILCDRNILKVIEQFPSQEIFMDGTFEIVKRGPYKQLLVIYCAVKGEVSSFLHKDCCTYNIHICTSNCSQFPLRFNLSYLHLWSRNLQTTMSNCSNTSRKIS